MLKQSFQNPSSSEEGQPNAMGQKSEKKLQFSELRYRRLFETAQDGVLILDAYSGKITDANPFLKKLLGYRAEELLGKQLWEIGVFKDIVDSKKAFRELQTKGYIRYKDLPLKTKDGRIIDVEFVSNAYMVETEKVIQCNIRDITNRKKAQAAIEARSKELEDLTKSQEETKKAMLNIMEDLKEAKTIIEIEKAKDEAILASIGEGLIAVDTRRKVIIINKAAEKMLGWKMKEMVGKEITSFPLEDEDHHPLPFAKRPTFKALRTGKPIATSYYFVRKDKTRFPIALNVTPIKLDGKIIGALDIFRDITQEKEIDKAKSEFVSLASHQLRTPLGIIKWYIEALEEDPYIKNAPAVARKYLAEIYKSNERVLSLVRDLLSVSRIEQGRVKNAPQSADLIQVVKEVVEQMQIVARKKGLRLSLVIKNTQIPALFIDVLRFHEVIENLLSNAIEYTRAPASIEVTLTKTADTLLLAVKDEGIGIAADDQKKLFTKFYRSENAVTHNPEGSGLGLYVVKAYVEGWGGAVAVQSVEGQGSTFSISLPLRQKKDLLTKQATKKKMEVTT